MSSGDRPEPQTPTPSPYVSPSESPAEATAKAVGAGILLLSPRRRARDDDATEAVPTALLEPSVD